MTSTTPLFSSSHPHLPRHFHAAQFEKQGDSKLHITRMDMREPRNGEVLVRVIACGMSMMDTIAQEKMMKGVHYPITPGSEIVGDVVMVCKNETKWREGDRVGACFLGGYDMECQHCRAGDFVQCQHPSFNGVTRNGGYAEFVMLRSEAVVAVPRSMDPAQTTAFLNIGSCLYNALLTMNVTAGELVGIDGMGGVAGLACDLSNAMGYRTVMIGGGDMKGGKDSALMDKVSHMMPKVEMCSMAKVEQMGGAKVILCLRNDTNRMQELINSLQPNGQLLILMAMDEDLNVPVATMLMKRLMIRGYPICSPYEVEQCLNFVKMNGIEVQLEKYELEEVNKAWEKMMDQNKMEKIVLCVKEQKKM